MTTLKVTPEEMQNLAGEMRTEIAEIQRNLNNIEREVSNTKVYWRGDASDKHVSNYQEIAPQGQTLIANLNTAPDDMLKIAGLYTETEEAIQQITATLPDDIFG